MNIYNIILYHKISIKSNPTAKRIIQFLQVLSLTNYKNTWPFLQRVYGYIQCLILGDEKEKPKVRTIKKKWKKLPLI